MWLLKMLTHHVINLYIIIVYFFYYLYIQNNLSINFKNYLILLNTV